MSTGGKQRLDLEMLTRNLAGSREKAQALILAGKVLVDGQRATKSGQPVTSASRIEVEQPLKYVSRGGFKLEAALDRFNLNVSGRVAMDIGTSTGGFTDCLLQRGVAKVHAVDTGAGQIDWKLRSDPRVQLHERTNARYLTFDQIGEQADLIACDVSFISVTLVFPALEPLLRADGDFVVLIKPQFEAGRDQVGPGGIVRDPVAHQFAIQKVSAAFEKAGFTTEVMDSPILGAEGNREFLLHARR